MMGLFDQEKVVQFGDEKKEEGRIEQQRQGKDNYRVQRNLCPVYFKSSRINCKRIHCDEIATVLRLL